MVTPINPMIELSPTFTQDEAGADELGRDRGMQITHFFNELSKLRFREPSGEKAVSFHPLCQVEGGI